MQRIGYTADRKVRIVVDGTTLEGRNICPHCGSVALALRPKDLVTDCDCLCHQAAVLTQLRAQNGSSKRKS